MLAFLLSERKIAQKKSGKRKDKAAHDSYH